MNLRRDAIVSIGAVRIEGLKIITGNNFFSYVRPKRSMPKVSTHLIHRITPDQIESAPELRKVLPDFLDFAGQRLVSRTFYPTGYGLHEQSFALAHGRPITKSLPRFYEAGPSLREAKVGKPL